METAAATMPSARLKKAESGLRRTVHENSVAPNGRFQVIGRAGEGRGRGHDFEQGAHKREAAR